MKNHFIHQKIIIFLYTLSLLFFGYFLIRTLLVSNPTECTSDCLGAFFVSYADATMIGILSLIVLLQLFFLIMNILKKDWLSEHISFKILTWTILLIPAAVVIWMFSQFQFK
jgi:hypothetical protein